MNDKNASDRLLKLSNDHWEYVELLLRVHGLGEKAIQVVSFHYKSAFIHGYKHAMEDAAK